MESHHLQWPSCEDCQVLPALGFASPSHSPIISAECVSHTPASLLGPQISLDLAGASAYSSEDKLKGVRGDCLY